MRKYRIKKIEYSTHVEYWVQRSVKVLWVHVLWLETTASYFSKYEFALDEYNDRIKPKLTTIIR